MADNNPIKYSDLIVPDDSITKLISQLQELIKEYNQAQDTIKGQAQQAANSLKNLSGATEDGRNKIREFAAEAERLAKSEKELSDAQKQNEKTLKDVNNAVNAEVKAFSEFRAQIDAVSGSIKTNTDRYTKAVAALKQYRAEQAAINKAALARSGGSTYQYTDAEIQRMNQLTLAIAETTQERNKASRAINQEIKDYQSAAGSLNQMRAQLSTLKAAYADLSGEVRNGAIGKEMIATIGTMSKEISAIEQSMGVYSRNVGNYASAWNGLGVSIQQIARELPSLSMGANMFFLAISNNLPMLADELKRARVEYDNLRKSGQKATPVWKQVISSIFSWQTALVAGITVLTLYGQELVNWIADLFSSKNAILSAKEANEQLNASLQESDQGYAQNIYQLKQLQLEYKNITSDTQLATWIENNQQKFAALGISITDASDAENVFVKNTKSVIAAFKNRAKAAAAQELAQEKYREAFQKRLEAETEAAKGTSFTDVLLGGLGQGYGASGGGMRNATGMNVAEASERQREIRINSMYEEADAVEKTADQYFNLANAYKTEAQQALQSAGIRESSGTVTPVAAASKSTTAAEPDYEKEFAEAYERRIEALRDYQDARIELEMQGAEKQRVQTELEYDRQIEDLQYRLDNEKDLTQVEQESITAQILLLTQQRHDALQKLENELWLEELNARKARLEQRLEAVEKESEEEYKIRLALIETERNIAQTENNMQPAGQRVSSADIDTQYNNQSAELIANRAEKVQKDSEKEAKEYANTLKSVYNTAQQTISQFSQNSASAIGNFTKIMQTDIGGKTVYEHLGLTQEQAYAAAAAAGVIIGSLQDIAAARVEAANAAVQQAEKETDAARDALQAELEARANGYANNVTQAQKELKLAQENQRKAEQEQQKALQAQQAIQSVQQMSNLVTATALIWSQLGFPLAIPAIAVMWASFAAAKIKAAQLTSSSSATEQYGEGTVELLSGGSHQSGNDVDLGTKPDGTRRRAEGGEFFAVINKRNSRKFRSVIPDVIHSLNDGSFAHKYLAAYDKDAATLINLGSDFPDIEDLKKDVKDIKNQNKRRRYVDGRGNTVEVYKNLTRRTIR
jgi:hypothetical protein